MPVVGPYRKEYEYIGLSTDTKPVASVHLGSKFYETDTGLLLPESKVKKKSRLAVM
jgi:hypothetical protein